jgi:hypothetical protein
MSQWLGFKITHPFSLKIDVDQKECFVSERSRNLESDQTMVVVAWPHPSIAWDGEAVAQPSEFCAPNSATTRAVPLTKGNLNSDSARHLRRNGETDGGAPRVRRCKAAWYCVDCYAGRLETHFHVVYGRLSTRSLAACKIQRARSARVGIRNAV